MYRVQYYAPFSQKWIDYQAITHNSSPRDYATAELALDGKRRLEQMHPRDTFRIVARDKGKLTEV